MVRISELMTAT